MSASTGNKVSRDLYGRLLRRFLGLNERAWQFLPERVRGRHAVRAYGAWLHKLVGRQADREMYLGTAFLRNRPTLELMRRLVHEEEPGSRFEIAVLGCSIGVEVYSILWTLRSSRPDLDLVVRAVDVSPDVLRVAERGVYAASASELVKSSIFEGLTVSERREMFEWDGGEARIKPWLSDGVTWELADASDPTLITSLGLHDLVVANNFLCHMTAPSAEACLRNLAGLVRPGGHLLVTGVDLDVRTKVALESGWEPVPELREEIHDGDPLVRADWPWRWWGLEPLDRRRPDWETRYTAVFRIAADSRAATNA
jgi:chemotaxis protein methyltransferase CheR